MAQGEEDWCGGATWTEAELPWAYPTHPYLSISSRGEGNITGMGQGLPG